MADQTYLVTARKYRPQLFGDVVAQEHVSETLKNAIRLDRLAHAYMFTGPRGVGKTTAARILAKAINCTVPLDERPDGAEPCRSCDSCRSFEEARNLNIIEIDAASNNKVEDIRDLRETVRIPPQGGRMKVYIVDEVHMLTTSAFNALLKTLEEPPPYALFIFATTEPHKVLPTIQSRCQRFDFRRIAVPEIVSRLLVICDEENITADEASLMLIARKGDGALRDAFSVFDQAVSLCGTNLVYEELVEALGVVDTDLYFAVTEAAEEGNVSGMIEIVERIVGAGYDLQEFLDGLAEHLRNLLVIRTVGDASLVEATSKDRDRYADVSQRFTDSVLLRFVHIAGETADALRTARQPRLRLEMALLKLASLPSSLDLATALEKIDRLEQLLSESPGTESGGGRTRGQQQRADTSETGPPEPPPVRKRSVDELKKPPSDPKNRAEKPVKTSPADVSVETSAANDPIETPSEDVELEAPSAHGPAADSSDISAADKPESGPGSLSLPFDPPALKRPSPESGNALSLTDDSGSVEVVGGEVDVAEARAEPVPSMLAAAWKRLLDETMENQVRLGSLLRHTRILSLKDRSVVIGVPDAFHGRMLRSERSTLAKHLEELSGVEISELRFSVSEDQARESESGDEDTFDARAFLKKKCEENPAVKDLMERFGGEIVW